ncbi:MarR family transcriptional regulator [Listeria fleischmannii]|uniref:Putative cytosolic protein n=1 Tax=Listeria fleischmannii FSL S10-1203 TaxID=1265822 RepID=W7CRU6_9LIST|nr:helix-turn-helix domain-containing protein [Listeria fleischmannii]EUJ42329.1 putative cytosolic protein [Listeria fleischmannii FSL S10-1203]
MLNKTIKELAEEFGVTKQTIQYHLKSLPTKETTKSDKGYILIKPNGQNILRGKIQVKIDKENDKITDKESISLSVIELLEKQLDAATLQLKEKDKQLASIQKLLDQQQQLLLKEQQKKSIVPGRSQNGIKE